MLFNLCDFIENVVYSSGFGSIVLLILSKQTGIETIGIGDTNGDCFLSYFQNKIIGIIWLTVNSGYLVLFEYIGA